MTTWQDKYPVSIIKHDSSEYAWIVTTDHSRLVSTWWRNRMETFSALRALCGGNSPVTGEFPSQRPVPRALMVSSICAWTNGWVNNRDAGDLRSHRAQYDVTVMSQKIAYDFYLQQMSPGSSPLQWKRWPTAETDTWGDTSLDSILPQA